MIWNKIFNHFPKIYNYKFYPLKLNVFLNLLIIYYIQELVFFFISHELQVGF